MRFTYLKLVNFKRFPLRELEVLEHNFTSKLLMVAGPNGAGKSSLLNELSPLPSDKGNYNKNGYKEIHIEKDDHRYVLISDFRSGTNYSFLCDGEELNKAGLVTTQKELAEQHFKITQVIHELMVGIESFTEMSLPARKKLFSAITHLNIDKVLEGYNHLKEELKGNKLLLKTQTTAYQVEEEKLQDKTRLEGLRNDLEALKVRADRLLAIRNETQRYAPHSSSETALLHLANRTTAAKQVLQSNYVLLSAYPNRDLPRYHTKVTNQLSVIDYKLNQTYKELEIKQRELKAAEIVGINNQQSLLEERSRLDQFVRKSLESLRIFKDIDTLHTNAEMALYKLESSLPDILQYLQPNVGLDGERLFTVDKYNRLVEEKHQQVDQLQQLTALEISVKQSISQANDMKGDISCPACSHSWPIKDALQASLHTQDELERLQKDQFTLRGRIASTERSITELTEYFTLYKQFTALRKDTELALAPFWKTVHDRDLIFSDPSSINGVLSTASMDLSTIAEIRVAKTELANIDKKLEQIETIATLNVETVKADIRELDQLARETQLKKDDLNRQLSDIRRASEIYSNLEKLDGLIQESRLSTVDHNTAHLLDSLCRVIDDELRNLKVTIITIENELHQATTIQYALDKYTKDIENTKENIKVLELALEELCPKSGLIAKSVSSFLNVIIGSVNGTLRNIWDYKMILKPIDVDNDSLNYRFKVEVEDKLEISDVALVSGGMKEIINLSFKMVLYKLLGLEGYPLWLDEFGSKLDSLHRSHTFSLIFGLMNSTQFNQIFMITHIDTSFANFRDVEVLEL